MKRESSIHNRIAQWVDVRGDNTKLFSTELVSQIAHWNEVAEEVLDSGRAIFLARVVDDEDARARVMPQWAARLAPMHGLVRARCGKLLEKYGGVHRTKEAHVQRLRSAFERIRNALSAKPYILGHFTFADIAATAAVHYLQPVVHPRVPISPRSYDAWVVRELAADFVDLIRYRDQVYAKHR